MLGCEWRPRGEPGGLRRFNVSLDTGGSLPPALRSTGMPSGLDINTDAEIASCQLPLSTIATAFGRLSADVAGKTALTTPATSATVSAPATRVVFFVAVTGKPSSAVADWLPASALISGGAPPPPPPRPLLSLRPAQPDTARSAATRST